MTQHSFLDRALQLHANGYEVIPIAPGQKRPGVDDWQSIAITEERIREWARGDFARGNVGIRTSHTPAVDLDIYDAEMAQKMQSWIEDHFGEVPMRVGQAPKRLFVFTTNEPFRKVYADWVDKAGTKHRVEVLGHGQQFVAYGTHPDTKQPFRWLSMEEPLDKPADELIRLGEEDARLIVKQFGIYAKEAGWTCKHDGTASRGELVETGDPDDVLLNLKPRLKITGAEIEHALQFVDGADDYDRWIMVGMALHHQSRGHPKGLEMWDEWSSQAANYDPKACEKRWNSSFKDAPSTHRAVTFASVLRIANERERQSKDEEFNRLLNVLRNSTDEKEIVGPIAKELAAAIHDDFQLDIVAKKMQDRIFELTEVRPRIDVCRKALMPSKRLTTNAKAPSWCDGWVFVTKSDKFYHIDRKLETTERGFNALHDREVLTDEEKAMGVALPAARAGALALNVYGIPVIEHMVYMPGMDKVLEINGRMVANTYDETSTPEAKQPTTAEEHEAIEIVERHFELLISDPMERAIVLDYLSYTVQNPIDKIVWAVLMQGAEGAGKTFIMRLMQRVLGPSNVGPIAASDVQDKYTGWGEGKKLAFIEEIRLHGSNRYETLDKLKPYVSNEEVTIRKMNTDPYEIPNVTNYVLFTNYWDALPISRMDRRYFVVGTTFQTKEQLTEFNEKNPDYFVNLFTAANRHGDVLRWWFLNRDLSPKFQPKRPALDTHGKDRMRAETTEHSDEADVLNDILEESQDPELSSVLLNSDKLKHAMDMSGRCPAPYGRAFATMLSKAGFHMIGRFRVDTSNPPVRYYTKTPHRFERGQELAIIRSMIELSAKPPDDDDPFA